MTLGDGRNLMIVTGAPRSGEWLVGGVLHALGAWAGDIDDDSRENRKVRDDVTRAFMKGLGAEVRGMPPLPDLEAHEQAVRAVSPTWGKRVEAALEGQGYEDGPIVLVSGPACLLWRLWRGAFPAARWVVARRRDADTLRAWRATGELKDAPPEVVARANRGGLRAVSQDDAQRALGAYQAAFDAILASGAPVRHVWTHRVLQYGDLGELHHAATLAGLVWDEDRIVNLLTPTLWRGGVFERRVG